MPSPRNFRWKMSGAYAAFVWYDNAGSEASGMDSGLPLRDPRNDDLLKSPYSARFARIPCTLSLASPNSITVLSLKNSGLSTPA